MIKIGDKEHRIYPNFLSLDAKASHKITMNLEIDIHELMIDMPAALIDGSDDNDDDDDEFPGRILLSGSADPDTVLHSANVACEVVGKKNLYVTSLLLEVGGTDAPSALYATVKIKLVSSADTGFFYVTRKNPRNQTEKMVFKKYDPVARKHVEFKEAKIK